MIYTVTLNPAVDCALSVSDYCAGRVNRAESETVTAGGKGINMSVILSRLGIATRALGFCGGETGRLLCGLLDGMGCPNDMTELEGQLTRINMKLHTRSEETEINGKGPVIGAEQLESFTEKLLETVNEGDSLILAGSVPESVPDSIYADIMKRFKGRNVRIIADTSGKLLVELLAMKPFLIKPNNFELGDILGCEINTRRQALDGAEKLREIGALNVLVSLGDAGAVLLTEAGEKLEISAPEGKARSTVGAGDSMVAGFLAGLELFGDYSSALTLGIAAGSATAFSDSLAEKNEIAEIFYALDSSKKNSLN